MTDPEITDPRDPHKRRDVVAELDRWLDNSNDSTTAIERRAVLRARDEIVALREKASRLERGLLDEWGTKLIAKARAEALEKAARVCSRMEDRDNFDCAAAIRALNDKRDE